jgi:hypothetical protein
LVEAIKKHTHYTVEHLGKYTCILQTFTQNTYLERQLGFVKIKQLLSQTPFRNFRGFSKDVNNNLILSGMR